MLCENELLDVYVATLQRFKILLVRKVTGFTSYLRAICPFVSCFTVMSAHRCPIAARNMGTGCVVNLLNGNLCVNPKCRCVITVSKNYYKTLPFKAKKKGFFFLWRQKT